MKITKISKQKNRVKCFTITCSQNSEQDRLWKQVKDVVRRYFLSEGFSENEIPKYSVVEVSEYDKSTLKVEVRVELDFDGMVELSEELNPIIEKYDEDAYFDFEEPGIMSAYLRKKGVKGSILNDDYTDTDENEDLKLIKKAICADPKSIETLEHKGYVIIPEGNPLSFEEVGTYRVKSPSGKVYTYDNTLSYYSKVKNGIKTSEDLKESNNDYTYVTNVDGYKIYKSVVDGKGVWRAMKQDSDESQFDKLSFPITYEQARGYEPIGEPNSIARLRKDLGKMLLPNASTSVHASEDLSAYPESFKKAYTLAKNDFMNDYKNAHVNVQIDLNDPYSEENEVSVYLTGFNPYGKQCSRHITFDLGTDSDGDFDPDIIYNALEEAVQDVGIRKGHYDIDSSTSVDASGDISMYSKEFHDAYTSAYIEFKERYPQVEVSEIYDDPSSDDNEICIEICDTNSGNCGKLYLDTQDEFVDSDYILRSFEETAEAIGLLEDNTVYSSVESSDYESDSGIPIEDIIDSLEDNGYDLSRIRSIRKGLLELFGYKGKDADIIIHDLVAGGFIDPNDWVDKDYTPGIYSATNDGEGYWFFTTHGVQPGSVPKDVDILDIIDTPNGSFVKFDRFLSTKELNEYDMVEKAPKSVMSSKESDVRLGDTVEYNGDLYVIIDDEGEGYWFFPTHGEEPGSVPKSDLLTLRPQDRFVPEDLDDPDGGDSSEDIFLERWQLNTSNCKYVKSSEEDEDDDDLPMVDQEYDSAATSINSNKLPAIYKMINLEPGKLYLDFGGGKFDNGIEYVKDKGATLVVYDPYNRSAEHNKEVLRILRENGGADAAVNSNVLNVIKEPEARKNVLENIARITKPGAPIYITVYEGKGNGQEGPTKSGYQLNRKTADYLEEIQEVFPDATRRGKLITAHNTGSVTSSTDDQSRSTILCSYDEFITWYDNLSDEEQWKVDDIADTNGIPFYEEASDDELAWLHNVATSEIHASPVKSYTDVEEDISRYDKDIVSYRKIISKSVEDSDDFLTDYTMYEVVTEDGSVEYECYFGDNDLYGPWNGEGLDFEADNYDEAVEWYNSYSSDEIQSSTVLDSNTEFRENFEEAVDIFYEEYPATVELTDEQDEEYDTLYRAYVRETGALYSVKPGVVYIDIGWDSSDILQALEETAEAIGMEPGSEIMNSTKFNPGERVEVDANPLGVTPNLYEATIIEPAGRFASKGDPEGTQRYLVRKDDGDTRVVDEYAINRVINSSLNSYESPTSFRYKGRRIKLLHDGTGWAIFDSNGEMEEHGFQTPEDAKDYIDDIDSYQS